MAKGRLARLIQLVENAEPTIREVHILLEHCQRIESTAQNLVKHGLGEGYYDQLIDLIIGEA